VTYAIDTTNSGVDPNVARNAIIGTFEEFEKYIPGEAFTLINDFNAAKIKFRWQFIDGQFGQTGFATFSFTTPGLALTSATITLDSGENWFVSPTHRCNSIGGSLDIQNIASHELGHAVGLGHVNDNLLTMFPTSFAGETLKRSLGNGEQAGMNFLYPGSSTWASSWTSLGGGIKANTNPAVIANNDGRLQVFVIGTNNQLYYKIQSAPNSNTWSSTWTSLGGGLRASTDPIAIANNDGRLQVFVVSTNNQLFYKTQTAAGSSTWTGWTSLGGGIKADTSPAVARNTDGRLQVFVVGTNNQLQYLTQTAAGSSTWSTAWTSLGGGLRANTDPIAIANNDGRLQVFVLGTNNALFYKTQTAAGSSTWTGWTSLGGGIKADTSPAVARNTDGRLQVFIVGTNNQLYYKTQTAEAGSSWSEWSPLGGGAALSSSPQVALNQNGGLVAFIIGSNNNGLFYKEQTTPGGSSWSEWSPLGGGAALSSSPQVALNQNGGLVAFIIGSNNNGLFYKVQIIF
jgi:FlaG/FlaF family flagellin (archaellin)